jgi:hypothetical protein
MHTVQRPERLREIRGHAFQVDLTVGERQQERDRAEDDER